MKTTFDLPVLYTFQSGPRECSYIPTERASLAYRFYPTMLAEDYFQLLRRGWRRMGTAFFRPGCANCAKCIPLRIDVASFQPTKSQRRVSRRNADVELIVQPPTVTDDHMRIYNDYHHDMHRRRNWPYRTAGPSEYIESFLEGRFDFLREFLYYRQGELLAVGLVDVLPDAMSSIYFYHVPHWRSLSPGIFTVQQELRYAREHNKKHLYMGYWIEECQSMEYKNRFCPHELLVGYPADDEEPTWEPA